MLNLSESWLNSANLQPVRALLEMGGPVMLVLLAMSILALATGFYVLLTGAWLHPAPGRRMNRCLQLLAAGQGRAALLTLGSSQRRQLEPLVKHLLQARLDGQPTEHLRDTVAEKAQRLLQPFEAPHRLLEVIAALAPLLGLLGTVLGMMEAFSTLATSSEAADPAQLSGGIYQALITTAGGLIVAIPVAAMAAWMDFRLRRIHDQINSILIQAMTLPLSKEAVHAAT